MVPNSREPAIILKPLKPRKENTKTIVHTFTQSTQMPTAVPSSRQCAKIGRVHMHTGQTVSASPTFTTTTKKGEGNRRWEESERVR